jgi:hypothetical protein
MFLMHVNEKPRRPSEVEPPGGGMLDVPPWLDTLVCQLLEKKPEHRPLDAAMVTQALDEVRDKVKNQRSAAAESARKVVRSPAKARDRQDLQAAETLVSGVGKKGKRKKEREAAEQKALLRKAAGPVLGLLAVAGLIAYLLWPAGPDRLLQEGLALVREGDAQFDQGDENCYYRWDDAAVKFNRVLGFPDHPAAKEARAQLHYIEAGKLYLRLKGTLATKDWEKIRKTSYEDLFEKYADVKKFLDPATKALEKVEAPKLLEAAQKEADPDREEKWPAALAKLRTLLNRYPQCDQAADARDLQARLVVHREALDRVKPAVVAKQPPPPQAKPARDYAYQALYLELTGKADQAKKTWQKLVAFGKELAPTGKRNVEDPEHRPWVLLAQAKLDADREKEK